MKQRIGCYLIPGTSSGLHLKMLRITLDLTGLVECIQVLASYSGHLTSRTHSSWPETGGQHQEWVYRSDNFTF